MAGDDHDVRNTIEWIGPDILRYFERRTASPQDAEDLLSETLLQVWRRRKSLPRRDEERRMWTYGVAHRVLAHHRRSIRRSGNLTSRLAATVASPEEPDLGTLVAVRSALGALDDHHRDLVTLLHWEGLSIGEAAGALGLNASTARGRYAAAGRALRESMEVTTSEPGRAESRR